MVNQVDRERRNGLRVDFETKVTVTADGLKTRYIGSSRDLSLRGVFISTDTNIPAGTVCQVDVILTGLENDLVLKMKGHVVRGTDEGYAIYFDSVDVDSYTHLKNIVKYNAPDSDGID